MEEHKKERSFKARIVVVSTSRFEKFGRVSSPESADDLSGRIIKELLDKSFSSYSLIPDEENEIKRELQEFLESGDDLLIFCGGTGLSPKDITIETVSPYFEKRIEGFGELFRALSMKEIGSSAMLSRATGGVIKGKVIFCIPGSPRAVELAMKELILKEASHILNHVRGYA